jgi:hypothetical protein
MRLEQRKLSGREKNEAAVELLAQLREKLHCEDISKARKAAFQLSWMQEDGLDILAEALFGNCSRTTKLAAAYGLRKMNGRMGKMAEAVFTRGLTHSNRISKDVCTKALLLMKEGPSAKKMGFRGKPKPRRPGIREIRGNSRPRSQSPVRGRPSGR